ncbi:MAG: hypothetical protein EOO43_01855 [Flavobacterium sp.]|nr:MAG: hypothetical protein EOO43_01855 [Flavobacterium sp.]
MNDETNIQDSQSQTTPKPEWDFGDEISNFIKHLEAQADILPLVLRLVSVKLLQEHKHVDQYIKKSGIQEQPSGKDKVVKLSIPLDKIKGFIDVNEKVETTRLAHRFLPINFVVSFVSQYDAFLGRLIRTMFISTPELLNNSEKNILFSELTKFSSLDEAREFVIEKEVESVLRESHLKQFKWLESKLNITLRKDLASFSDFIEITERRNLFVHCDGVVSRQYLEVCKENHVQNIEKVVVGQKLLAKPSYTSHCYSVLFEIAVKLGQVAWRKLKPDDLLKADNHLNNVCYELLVKGHYKLALKLLTFATDVLKKHHDQQMICTLTINKALAHYLANNKEGCSKVLAMHDWSASSDTFKLAVAVLTEDYNLAGGIMKSLGSSNTHINQDAYKEWPLFNSFRSTDQFKNTYREIYGEELIYIERKPRSLDDIITNIGLAEKEIVAETITALSNKSSDMEVEKASKPKVASKRKPKTVKGE